MNTTQRIVIFNRAPLISTDGWIHIVPKGELPNAEAGIVQVLDDQSMDSILDGIQKDKNRLGANWPGIYAGREHFIYDSDKDSAALAWFKEFQKRADGIWAKDDGLTPAGVAAVTNREYKFTSFVADPADLEKVEGKKFRVNKIETVGFTNYANGKELLTPITNRANNFADAGASAANQRNNTKKNMQKIANKLGLAAEASEDAILAEVTKLLNRADILPADLTKLQNRAAALETANQTLLGEQLDSLMAEHKISDEKVINRLKPALMPLKNREERLEYLADFGFKVGGTPPPAAATASATQGRKLMNRDTKPPGKDAPAGQQEGTDNPETARKIKNRANELKGIAPGRSFDSCWQQAAQEVADKS